MSLYADNDGTFPDEAQVWVRYPLVNDGNSDRSSWPWLPGHILGQCGPDEWHIIVDGVEELGEGEDGDGELLFPACFRDRSEVRTEYEESR